MVHIYRTVYEEMKSALLRYPPEHGGVLGAKRGEPISKFYFDESGVSTSDSYTPDYVKINAILDQWELEDVVMVGIAHSHEETEIMPSCGDLFYCERIFLANPKLEKFILPIVSCVSKEIKVYVCTLKDGHIKISQDRWQIADKN